MHSGGNELHKYYLQNISPSTSPDIKSNRYNVHTYEEAKGDYSSSGDHNPSLFMMA